MKKVAILSNYRNSIHFSALQEFSYRELARVFRENELELRRVSIYSFDREKGTFTDYVEENKDGKFEIFHGEYRPDVIWNRSIESLVYTHETLKHSGIAIFPSLRLSFIESDKYEMYAFLKHYQPYTLLLKDFFNEDSLRVNLSEKIVLKPIRSNSGKGILFLTQKELLEKREAYEGLEALFIVQEFIDFSQGLSDLAEGVHDIRLAFIGNSFSHSSIRIPQKGSLKSNIGSGGTERFLPFANIPKELWRMSEEIITILHPSREDVFSIDFGYCMLKNRWHVFEINCSPGVLIGENTRDGFISTYYTNMARFLRNWK